MPVLDHILRTPILDDELVEYHQFIEMMGRYYAPTSADRLFKVPVDCADEFSFLLNKFKKDGITIVRRAGGGPRKDAFKMTVLVKDAKYFVYYIRQSKRAQAEPLRVDPAVSNKELYDICGFDEDGQ